MGSGSDGQLMNKEGKERMLRCHNRIHFSLSVDKEENNRKRRRKVENFFFVFFMLRERKPLKIRISNLVATFSSFCNIAPDDEFDFR